jgi:hypothetical protein
MIAHPPMCSVGQNKLAAETLEKQLLWATGISGDHQGLAIKL